MIVLEGFFLLVRGVRVKVGCILGFLFRICGVVDFFFFVLSWGSMEWDFCRMGFIWVKLFRGKEGRYGVF